MHLSIIRAQITGEIVDAADGSPIPLASAIYRGNKKAVVSDEEGRFSIDRHNGWRLTISSVGYVPQVINITSSTPEHIVVKLKSDTKKLDEVTISKRRSSRYSRKDNPAVELMRKVIAAKKHTDLKTHDFYQYNNYQKLTLALNDLTPENLESKTFKKHPWLLNQVELCQYNERLILPVSVEETVKQKLYRKDPHTEKEIIKGETSTGVNDLIQTGDIVNTVIRDVFTDIDIYDDQVRLFQYPFTSPIGKDAIQFYRFYITDTLYLGDDRCIMLDFTPNNQQDFGFRGQIYIKDDSTYQVRRCELTIPRTSDVNWVENMKCIQEFNQLPNGEWVLTIDDMFVELKVANFLSKFIVIRNTRRTDFAFDEIAKPLLRGKKTVMKDAYAQMRDDSFWDEYRQVELTKSENSLDAFIKHIEDLKGFKYIIFGLKALIENFVETGDKDHPSKVDIGPINTIISQNFYDKWRLRASAQTTANFHPHIFLKGYVARGMVSKQNYYDAEVIYTFNKPGYLPREFPKQAITFQSMRDVALPSDKFIQTDKDNMFTSFKVSEINKMFLYNRQSVAFDYEQEWGFKMFAEAKTEKVNPIGDIAFERLSDHELLPSIRYTEATVGMRYAPGETFINTKQHRWPINLDAPVFRLQHTMGFKGVLGGQYRYNFTEGEIYKRLWMPMNWGKIDTRIKAGAQWNQVPYPLLIMPVANLGYILEDQTFNLINNMEFLNDRYMSVMVDWDLNGKIFNRIPLFRKLKWREWIGVRCLWGKLTNKNNPYLAENQGSDILMAFPEGCYVMDWKQPYIEASFGIHNIFKLLHVEYVRRFSYLDLPTANKQGVRFTIRTTF
ncbi:MAG: carboxypeptidase-like regulatory domain-containing protein [Prevotella sp.]|nr:carboxypeptidase-like regulatory domain-containing protein [Prevotella sp.]